MTDRLTRSTIRHDLPAAPLPRLTIARVMLCVRQALANARRIREPEALVVFVEGAGFEAHPHPLVALGGVGGSTSIAAAAVMLLANANDPDVRIVAARGMLNELVAERLARRGR